MPEGLPACGSLWPPVATDQDRLDAPTEEIGGIDAWRPEASMPGCNAGWLAAAGGLLLAGCCWLTEFRKLATTQVPHARRSRRSADFRIVLAISLTRFTWRILTQLLESATARPGFPGVLRRVPQYPEEPGSPSLTS